MTISAKANSPNSCSASDLILGEFSFQELGMFLFPLSSVISRTDYWLLKLRPTLWLFHKSEGLQAKWTVRDYDYSTYLPNFPPKANK